MPQIEGLAQVAVGAGGARRLGEQIVMSRDEDDRRHVASGLEQILKLESAQTAEVNVQNEALRRSGNDPVQELLGGRERFDADATGPQGTHEGRPKRGVVIDDADPTSDLAGGGRRESAFECCHRSRVAERTLAMFAALVCLALDLGPTISREHETMGHYADV